MILTKNTLQEIYRTNLNQIHILHEYKLREVTSEEALRLRHSGKPGLIIKKNSSLFYFKIFGKVNIKLMKNYKVKLMKKFNIDFPITGSLNQLLDFIFLFSCFNFF